MSENACGGASSSSTDTDKDSSVECPTCGRIDFTSKRGMRMHHARTHGESLSYTILNCEYCNAEYQYLSCNTDKSRFCSQDCLHEWQSQNVVGENHHQYSKVECECEICGEVVKRKKSHAEGNNFCSMECHREYQSIHQVGKNHHHYAGGRTTEYGPNWQRQRRKAISRDNGTCQRCGVTRSKLDRDIHVHHIEPRKTFMSGANFDYESANKLTNLICLCGSCHQTVEAWGLHLCNKD